MNTQQEVQQVHKHVLQEGLTWAKVSQHLHQQINYINKITMSMVSYYPSLTYNNEYGKP